MTDSSSSSAYRDAGVDIDAQERALARVRKLAGKTFTPGVLSEIGSFGGLFRPELAGMEEPVLVASADGVGTKLRVAAQVGDYSTVGRDLVNHCVNDVLVQGAEPLFFLDYVGAGVLEPEATVSLVEGVAAACTENGCALLGGETAEMPGFYQPGDYELVGFIVGLVDRPKILDGSRIEVGDLLVGLPSTGLHTNGYSLARKVIFEIEGLGVEDPAPWAEAGGGRRWRKKKRSTVGEELLAVHRAYLPVVRPLLGHPGLHGLAHVTGGGLTDNLPRMLPKKTHAVVRVGAWEIPPLFHWLQEKGGVDSDEMFRVFNMGIGMVLAVAPKALQEVLGALRSAGLKGSILGSVQKGRGGVLYDFGAREAPGDETTGEEEET
jgi:phosphoribosylformylglycinamidine cyclo-ligase